MSTASGVTGLGRVNGLYSTRDPLWQLVLALAVAWSVPAMRSQGFRLNVGAQAPVGQHLRRRDL